MSIDPNMPTLQVPLTNEQAYLYRHNAAFKTIVDTFLQGHLPLYLEGAVQQARLHTRGVEVEMVRRLEEVGYSRQMSAEEFGGFEQKGGCDICNGTGFDYLGRPCRIHGDADEED